MELDQSLNKKTEDLEISTSKNFVKFDNLLTQKLKKAYETQRDEVYNT